MKPQLNIAIQGIQASFHEVAAQKFFGNTIKAVECWTFVELFESLKNGTADYAVMAIENTVAGSLLQNYGLLQEYAFYIIGEVYLRIEMNLMALPGTQLSDVEFVLSHPIALRQCHQYLNQLNKAKLIEKEDTAASAKEIAQLQLKNHAAVASSIAAERFGLEILAQNIETNQQNFTRFVVLSKNKNIQANNQKASLFFNLGHEAGSLAKVLHIFAEHNINLTKIQSVPIIGMPYKYNFHVDLIWEKYPDFTVALEKVSDVTKNLSILGEYPKGVFDFEFKPN